MKKLGLAFIVLVVIGIIYYLTLGSAQIVDEMKKEVNSGLMEMEQAGFLVENREMKGEKEHFIIHFDDTKKIVAFLEKQGSVVDENDLLILKGLKIGFDIEYLSSTDSAMSVDIYPLTLPTNIDKELGIEESKSLKAIEEMMSEKAFLAHININKLLSGFDGYLQDIDRTFEDEADSHIELKGFKFNGDIEDEKITSLRQNLGKLSYSIENQLKVELSKLKTNILNSTKETDIDYSVQSLILKTDNNQSFSLVANSISGLSKDSIDGDLLNNKSRFKISEIDIKKDNEQHTLKNIEFDSMTNNLNIKALEKLEKFSSQDFDDGEMMREMIPILQKLTESDLSIDVSKISIGTIVNGGKSFDGFNLTALVKANKDFDWKGVEANPMMLMQVADLKSNITLSNEIFTMISQDPKAMMFMMLAQPKDKNGKKVYDLEFSKGSLKVNGKPFM